MSADYAAPFPEDCENGIDDDYDGKVDCSDSDCASFPGCMSADYAAPFPQEDCENGVDDDYDGKVDCSDDDCSADPACGGAPLYAAP